MFQISSLRFPSASGIRHSSLLLAGLLAAPAVTHLRADPGPLVLWSATPGVPANSTSWQQEAYPVGNGKLAAMIYGGVGSEQIQFNEDTVWGGQPHDYVNPGASWFWYTNIQAECFHTNSSLPAAPAHLMSVPIREAAYQPAGILTLTFPHSGTVNYKRSLDLNTATVNVHYDYNGVTYSRDIFASAPSNRVIAIRFTANQP